LNLVLQIIPILATSTLWNNRFSLLGIVFLTISNVLLNTCVSRRIYFSAHKMQNIFTSIRCLIQPKLHNILFQSLPAGFAFIRIRIIFATVTDFFIRLYPHTDLHFLSSIMYLHELISISASYAFILFWIENFAFRDHSPRKAVSFFI